MANELSRLSPPAGSTKRRLRVGRGEGSGKGKTAGRGSKGQRKRSKVAPWFEGGQMPLHRRLPKRGFTNIHAKPVVAISLEQLSSVFKAGETVNAAEIKSRGLIATVPVGGIKILGTGTLDKALDVVATSFSLSAIRSIRAAGGSASIDSEYIERKYATVKIGRINARFNEGDVVDSAGLLEKNLISHVPYYGVWVIGGGSLRKSLTIQASKFSSTAKDNIAKAGGTIELIDGRTMNLKISDYTVVRIRDLNAAFSNAEPGTVANAESLVASGFIDSVSSAGLWITGGKKLKRRGLVIEASHFDDSARARIEAASGRCVIQ